MAFPTGAAGGGVAARPHPGRVVHDPRVGGGRLLPWWPVRGKFLQGEVGDIYDLRLGYTVDISLESDTVTKITSKVVQTTNTLMGTVDSVNSSYGFLYVYATYTSGSGTTERIQVFTKKNNGTKIIDNKNDNNSRELKKILSGESVLISGIRQADGTFEASTIIILVD